MLRSTPMYPTAPLHSDGYDITVHSAIAIMFGWKFDASIVDVILDEEPINPADDWEDQFGKLSDADMIRLKREAFEAKLAEDAKFIDTLELGGGKIQIVFDTAEDTRYDYDYDSSRERMILRFFCIGGARFTLNSSKDPGEFAAHEEELAPYLEEVKKKLESYGIQVGEPTWFYSYDTSDVHVDDPY